MSFDICLTFNEDYAPHAAALIVSVMDHHKSDERIVFHLVGSELSDRTRECFNAMRRQWNFDFHWIDVSEMSFLDVPMFRGNHAANIRLGIGEFLPDVDKVLYLDCDIIVRSDLAFFFAMDIQGKYAAVTAMYPDSHTTVSASARQRAFASSGMLIDNAMFRKKQVFKNAMELAIDLKSRTNLPCPDQILLNEILCENVVYFPPSRLVIAQIPCRNMPQENTYAKCAAAYSPEEVDAGFKNPGIIHYTFSKPWTYDVPLQRHFWSDLYWKYLKRTPFFNGVLWNYRAEEKRFHAFVDGESGDRSRSLRDAFYRCLHFRDVETIFASLDPGKRLAFFGAGNAAVEALRYLRMYKKRTGKELRPVNFFVDNDPRKQGTELNGIPIRNVNVLTPDTEIVLASTYVSESLVQLYERGLEDSVRGSFFLDSEYFGRVY